MVKEIQSLEEFRQIINGSRPVIIDFWAPWCGPCRVISPIFEKLERDTDQVGFYKVNVDDQEAISQEVGIRAMPTFIAFHNGTKTDELVGANPQGLTLLLGKAAALST